jgi:class I fructose-bisphosphate aldolase
MRPKENPVTKPRLNRFLAADGRCLDVAVDHGFFGEPRFLPGIESMESAVAALVKAAPDAIQLSPGQARLLQTVAGPHKPGLVLRTDIANVYGPELPERLFSVLIDDAVEQALRLDAVCLCVNLFQLEGAPEVHEACVRNIVRLKPEADRYGMPLMVEPLVMKRGGGGYGVNGDKEAIRALVRQGVELGADVIKADPTDDLEEYHEVVEVAGSIPVLVRGGGRVSDAEVLRRTHVVLQQGAKGIVYGRNIIQHENPGAMTRALMAVVHEGADPDEAARLLRAAR